MTLALVLLSILAATLLIGWLVDRWDKKHQARLDQTQIRNLGRMANNMKKYLDK